MDNKTPPIMSLQSVSKTFRSKTSKVQIFNKAKFDIYSKETIAIVGASGIGKSTLLNLIGSIDKPDSGKILYNGYDMLLQNEKQKAQFRNAKLGFIFQFHYLLQGLTAVENVMVPGLIAQKTKKTIEKKAKIMLERVGLSLRLFHRVEDLSGGEQQRVALARALIMEPDIILADEPTGNLDQNNSRKIHALLDELNKEFGVILIVVTHNNELANMLHRKVTILDGSIVPA